MFCNGFVHFIWYWGFGIRHQAVPKRRKWNRQQFESELDIWILGFLPGKNFICVLQRGLILTWSFCDGSWYWPWLLFLEWGCSCISWRKVPNSHRFWKLMEGDVLLHHLSNSTIGPSVRVRLFWGGKWRNLIIYYIWRGVRSDAQLSCTETRFQKCSQSGKIGSKYPMLSIYMVYDVIPCKKIERNTQTIKIADFTL